jgi:DNA polymerase III epsilon subunit-like protein
MAKIGTPLPNKKLSTLNWREAYIIGFDVETAGPDGAALDPIEGRIVQLAFTVYTPGADTFGPEYERRCGSDGVLLTPDVTAIHRIQPEDIADKPPADELLEELGSFLSGFLADDHVFLGYNCPFDTAFLYQAFKRRNMLDLFPIEPYRVLDPLAFARKQWPHNRLPELAARLGIPTGGAHEACRDVRSTIQVMLRLADMLKLPTDFDALLEEQERCIQDWEQRFPHRYRDTLDKVLGNVGRA